VKICPVAIAVGCRKCPVYSVCPAKGVIGDFKSEPPAEQKKKAPPKRG
jgi:predicted transcriptional regulator